MNSFNDNLIRTGLTVNKALLKVIAPDDTDRERPSELFHALIGWHPLDLLEDTDFTPNTVEAVSHSIAEATWVLNALTKYLTRTAS
jgi:hypothetical protein